jgi:translocation and assembly module TamA
MGCKGFGGALALVLVLSTDAGAQQVDFRVPGAGEDLTDSLRSASLVLFTLSEGAVPASDVVAAARAEYGRLLGALYESGYYSGVISVRVDGREAADIPVLDNPRSVSRVEITVQPGPPFRFSRAVIAPLAPGTSPPAGFAAGQPAPSGALQGAVGDSIDNWRDLGHAKAEVAGQRIIANHANATLEAFIGLDPGPRLRFGPLAVSGNEKVRTERVRAIAGLPEGEVFDPEELRLSAERLRRTGAFRSVSLREAETPGPGDQLGIEALVEEDAPHRLGFGAELSSSEGLRLTSYWMHRNLLGGAERLRIDGEISGIGGDTGGEDYRLGTTFARPATFTPDTTLTFEARLEQLNEDDYTLKGFYIEGGLSHIFSETLSGTIGLGYGYAEVDDALGTYVFKTMELPVGVIWDTRDDKLNPTGGFYVGAEATPFLGFGTTGSGARLTADARAYRALGDRFVLAGRLQLGSVVGPSIEDTPRDFLFYSGGGGTVRGQDYQSLGVTALPGGVRSGGQQFAGLQTELRTDVTEKIGVVAFYDIGYVAAEDWGDAYADWQSGAGLGLRYDTGIGPLRVDVATPVSGGDGGVQIYIGIGQSF